MGTFTPHPFQLNLLCLNRCFVRYSPFRIISWLNTKVGGFRCESGWRESWARAPAITRAPETRDLSRIDRGSGIYKFRCGKKDSTLSRACVQSSTSLSLFVNRSGETQQGLASTHGRIGTQTDACCTLRFIISVAVWRCCFMQYVMFPRARVCVFFGP